MPFVYLLWVVLEFENELLQLEEFLVCQFSEEQVELGFQHTVGDKLFCWDVLVLYKGVEPGEFILP